MIWVLRHPQMVPEHLGFIPEFISEDDPHSAREQIDANYAHGGGWRPFDGFQLQGDDSIKFAGDPPLKPVAETWLRDERILLYERDWLLIMQGDGSWEISRID